jgi:hypothetical protein
LFLDIDGVLNRSTFRPTHPAGLASWIEPDLAANLVDLVTKLAAHVVICSDWRHGRTTDDLARALHAAGAPVRIHDVTPSLSGAPRWREIAHWLATHSVLPTSSVIIDDAFDMGDLAHRHIRTSPLGGLDHAAIAAALALF